MQTSSTAYVGRLAPSPTGYLHLGHAATFWTAYERALATGGTLLLRNEDLDPHRSRPEFVTAMVEDLDWLGIRWQQPVVVQSQRLHLYRDALQRLLEEGHVYPCTCSRKDLLRMTHAPHDEAPNEAGDEPAYPGCCRSRRLPDLPDLFAHNLRFRVREGKVISFTDGNLGPQRFIAGSSPGTSDFGDFLVWRRDGLPSYQLACAVDDADMRITEVVRGRDLLKSTARQLLLQRALGLPTPTYFHTRLLHDAAGQRLAKRHDALALRTLRERGHTPGEVLAMIQSAR